MDKEITYNTPTYNLKQADKAKAFESLKRFMSDAEVQIIWRNACKECNVPENTTDIDELIKTFKYLSQLPGATGVVGKSLSVRAVSYKLLKNNNRN